MLVLIWGSRNLTWKHRRIMKDIAYHATLVDPPPLPDFRKRWHASPAPKDAPPLAWLPDSEPLVLLNGDGPPGSKVRGAVGADKLAVFACMECWPERRRVRWFPPEPKDGETWAHAAARRDVEMAEARPERAYVVHENLDASKGSIITANAMKRLGLPFWYVRVSPAGEVLGVELR